MGQGRADVRKSEHGKAHPLPQQETASPRCPLTSHRFLPLHHLFPSSASVPEWQVSSRAPAGRGRVVQCDCAGGSSLEPVVR